MTRMCRTNGSGRGFTLVELMVAISVLSLIVLVLFRIFDQTQRAMRSNAAQVDVMEAGRAVMDLLKRDLEQVESPGGSTNVVNFYVGLSVPPHALDLPGDEPESYRVNEIDQFYFLKPNRSSKEHLKWDATVYRVLSRKNVTPDELLNPLFTTNLALEGIGWLARRTLVVDGVDPRLGNPPVRDYEAPDPPAIMDLPLNRVEHPLNRVMGKTPSDWVRYSRIADGIVHFKITPLDSRGQPLHYTLSTNVLAYYPRVRLEANPIDPVLGDTLFLGSSLPAAVQVELGILEPQATERLRALPNYQSRTNFLTEHAANIHFFKARIPLRNASKLLPQS